MKFEKTIIFILMIFVVLIINYSNTDLNEKSVEIKKNLEDHKPILEVDSSAELDEIEEPDDTSEIIKYKFIYLSNFAREIENPQNNAEISENAEDIIFEYDDYPDYPHFHDFTDFTDYTDYPSDEITIPNIKPDNEANYISETETNNPFILSQYNETNINPYVFPVHIPLYNDSATYL